MRSLTGKAVCVLAALGALASCAPGTQMGTSATTTVEDLTFIFDGRNVNDAYATQPDFVAALGRFEVPRPAGATDEQWVVRIRGDNGNPPSPILKNLGGILGHAFLQGADQTVGAPGNYEQAIEVLSHGQILDYAYNAADGSGHIEVATYYDLPAGPIGRPARTIGYKYKVRVDPGGFSVHPKSVPGDPGYDPNNVFPGTIPISATKAQDVAYKLWAKGTSIHVDEVWRDLNIPTGHDPNWQPVPNSGPTSGLYETDASSCVDMMWQTEPPATLPPGAQPPLYCLGRCDSPLIINTK